MERDVMSCHTPHHPELYAIQQELSEKLPLLMAAEADLGPTF